MKLYSMGRSIFFGVLTALIVIMLGLGIGLIRLPVSFQARPGETGSPVSQIPVEEKAGVVRQTSLPRGVPVSDIVPYTPDEKENITIYDQLNPGVVNITTESMVYNWFLEPEPRETGSGSGSIIDAKGYVLTNNHVIENAYKVLISLADGSQHEGEVVGTDPENDIAVLKFDPPQGVELVTIPFGDSTALKVGQKVLAIGNPFALERTLTVGIVSGLGRPIQTSRNHIIQNMIQTDASINPGNSGGPLLDTLGRMIGMNTMIFSPSGGSVGIGFAVPVNTAKRVVAEIIEFGKVRRGWIDITPVQLFPSLVRYAKLPVSQGLLVSRTLKDGLAEKGGLRQGTEPVRSGSSVIYLGGDIIVSVDGMKTGSLADLYSALEDNKPGDVVEVEVVRGTSRVKLPITLADREEFLK